MLKDDSTNASLWTFGSELQNSVYTLQLRQKYPLGDESWWPTEWEKKVHEYKTAKREKMLIEIVWSILTVRVMT